MLQEVVAHPAFHSGDTTTDFVSKYLKTNKTNKVK
jgi:acetyl-CoA carboxylase biotin carboxylase subunit